MDQESRKLSRVIRKDNQLLLNQQIAMEAKASASYLAMASWCDEKGYKYSADFLYQQAEEEHEHMLKIFHYLNDAGGRALQPEITGIQQNFTSLKEVFETALNHEIRVTEAIHHIVKNCWENQDFATWHFFQSFVQEQIEEETTARRIIDLFDIIGEEGVGLYLIDKEIGTLKSK